MKLQAVFFDRDGTLGVGCDDAPQSVVMLDYAAETLRRFKARGVKVFIFTNQSCIARKKDNGYDFAAEFAAVGADDWFICPHDTPDNCDCRKPKNGLLKQAEQKYGLDLTKCAVVGDRWTDIECGQSVGARTVLVRTGRGAFCEQNNPKNLCADVIADDVRGAADALLRDC